jgi:trimeric autotransporter adhesin
MQLYLRAFLKAAVAGGAAGVGIGLTLWAHAALASPGTPPAPVQLCAKAGGAVVYAASGTCPGNTTAIAPVAQQSGVADLYTRLNADDAAISSLQGQVTSLQTQATTANTNIASLQTQVTSLQIQVTTANAAIGTLQSQATTANTNIASLQSLLNGVSRGPDASRNGYNTLVFSGMNLQVVNGTGSEGTINGLGNLIVGYNNPNPFGLTTDRTGSHNLITGDESAWSSYGGLLAGDGNFISGPFASVTGGSNNSASGVVASVSGGFSNGASGGNASVSGGSSNSASGIFASVSGGDSNIADGLNTSVSGGLENTASGDWDAILGGHSNTIASTYRCAYFPGSPATSTC